MLSMGSYVRTAQKYIAIC